MSAPQIKEGKDRGQEFPRYGWFFPSGGGSAGRKGERRASSAFPLCTVFLLRDEAVPVNSSSQVG